MRMQKSPVSPNVFLGYRGAVHFLLMLHKLLFPEFCFRKDYPVFRIDEKAVPFFGDLFPGFDTCEEKTEGYFLVCFLSFLMERNMERLLTQEKKTVPVSPESIREALLSMQPAQGPSLIPDTGLGQPAPPWETRSSKSLK